MISPIGVAWSRTKPNGERSAETSSSFAPAKAVLLGHREHELEPYGRRAGLDRARRQLDQHGHGGLVVGAEDRVAGAAEHAVRKLHLDRAVVRHGVEVGEERDVALPSPRHARDQVPGPRAGRARRSVLLDLHARNREARPARRRRPRARRPVGLAISQSRTNRSRRRWSLTAEPAQGPEYSKPAMAVY